MDFQLFEVAEKNVITGRRPIKMVLHEVHPDPDHFQGNGISWNETFTRNNLPSVIGMSIVAEFINEERDAPYGHGLTDIKDNMPLFEDATMVGHFDKAYIDDIVIDGENKRVLIGEGTLDEMRYPKFVEWLRQHMQESCVKGSVEIVGKPENDKHIIYSDGWKEKGRVPMFYDYSGYAILGVAPADEAAIVMELNQQTGRKEEDEDMNEEILNEIKAGVEQLTTELNSKCDALKTENDQLKQDVSERDAKIAELNAKITQYETDIAEKDAALTSAQNDLAEANSAVAEMQKAQAIQQLDDALAKYTDEQKGVATTEINAYRENPDTATIDAIVGKICTEIVNRQMKTNEVNSLDVFGDDDLDDNAGGSDESEDADIF